MSYSARFINMISGSRLRQIDRFRSRGALVQQEQFRWLMEHGAPCSYLAGKGVTRGCSQEDFRRRIPVVDYDALYPEIEKVRAGQANVLYPDPVKWFARSSGTTGDRSKYIPVTKASLWDCHYRGARDVTILFARNHPRSKAFDGKALTLGGSHRLDTETNALSGDLSAIMIRNTPVWANFKRTPDADTALIPDFEEKVGRICEETTGRNVTSFAGVPSWNMVLMNRILDYTGKSNMHEVWPDMSLFMHGGVCFTPYREQYRKLFPSEQMKYIETYNASEGFFAIQDDPSQSDMLLMLDYRIYYEFLPLADLSDTSKAVPLEGVCRGVNYAMIISTNGGLWRYMIGDTVEFTSLSPYKIRITGRTKQYMNAFGEEVIVDNADRALHAACEATAAVVSDYTAAPVYMSGREKGAHQWLVEFEHGPASLEEFTAKLDRALQELNSDYEAKRFRDTTLHAPEVIPARKGLFYRWMADRGKVGGQNKVPRLSNDRSYMDALLEMNKP